MIKDIYPNSRLTPFFIQQQTHSRYNNINCKSPVINSIFVPKTLIKRKFFSCQKKVKSFLFSKTSLLSSVTCRLLFDDKSINLVTIIDHD